MTADEKAQLVDFLRRLVQAGEVAADAEASTLIQQTAAQQPAALYLSIQRAVYLENALREAQQRIQTLESRAAGSATSDNSSWLSSTWGSGADSGRVTLPPSTGLGTAAAVPAQATTFGTTPGLYPAGGFAPASGFLGGGGSFLASAAATAAGVAAGELLANALSNHGGHGNRGFADLPSEATADPADLADSSDSASIGDFDSNS